MLPILILSITTTLIFGGISIYLSFREEKTRQKLLQESFQEKRKSYEISILKSLQDKIGYSLNIEQVADTLISSLGNLCSYSVVSSLVILNDKAIFKSYVDEPVSNEYIQTIRKNMINSLQSVRKSTLPDKIVDINFGLPLDNSSQEIINSFFDIPIIVNSKTVGLIYISSTKPNFYSTQEVQLLYDVAKLASTTLSRLEEVITTEKSKLTSMISSLAEGIFMIDKNLTISIVNENAKKILNLNSETIDYETVSSSFPDKFAFTEKIQNVLMNKKTIEEKELSLGNKIIRIVMTPVMNLYNNSLEENGIIGVSILLHDITLEKTLSKLKEDFTSEVVHELRSPLTAIQSGSELMINQKDHLDKDQENKLLEIINKQSKRMLGDINSLLDAAKLDSGHFAIYQKPEDVEIVLKDASELFHSEAEKKHITLSVDIEKNLPKGLFDQIRINQVLNNLISNSLKYTPEEGKIIVSAKLYSNPQLPASPTNPGIIVSIADNGIGIAPDKQVNLFSKFARLENIAYVHSKEGTGLGLYITKGIVESHGGKIFLESYPNKGTTVSFTLPIANIANAKKYQLESTAAKESSLMKVVN